MNKNLIKIEGVYIPLEDGEKFNIFCTMEINFNVFNTFANKNSQKSEEEQSVENFSNLLEKLKNL